MPRLGRNGDMIGVYKFRTMHPYAEYLQDYVLKMNGYAESGKPKDDFRLTPWGKILRRYWLDELPQLLNVLKGELKIVGVRPISKRYFQDVPKDLQILRLRQKPGCIPPYVALNRHGNVTSVLQAEREYLTLAINHSIVTDFHYFFMALYNILVKNKRSA
jgi:lipopolysaccharide/colanic/teichoic acid biosynthesis glycosyltransferase